MLTYSHLVGFVSVKDSFFVGLNKVCRSILSSVFANTMNGFQCGKTKP